MEYKYELHCHTKEVSRCGQVPARDIVRMYKEKGYSGIVITDHYSPLTFLPDKVFAPQKHIDYYLEGYRRALDEAGEDFTILLGMELRFYATVNDYLVYGVTEEFLKNSGNLMMYYQNRFSKLAHNNNMLFLQAHPFRPLITRVCKSVLDGAEVYNGKAGSDSENVKAAKWAQSSGFPIRVSGSDFHSPAQLAKGGIVTNRRISSNDDLLEILRNGSYSLIETSLCQTESEKSAFKKSSVQM